MRTLVAFALVSTALAGCVTNGPLDILHDTVAGPLEVTGGAYFADAVAEAEAWSSSARLVSVTSTEGEPIGDLVDPPLFWNTAADPAVGNGRAMVWTYTFAGPNSSTLYYLSKGPDGTTLYARELPLPYMWIDAVPARHASHEHPEHAEHPADDSVRTPPPMPRAPPVLSAPAIDSDAAMEAANAFAPFAEFADAHPRHQVAITLGTDGTATYWAFFKRTATYFGAVVVVDAATGALAHTSSWPSPPGCPGCCFDCPPPPPPPPPEPRPGDVSETWSASAPSRLVDRSASFETTFEVVSGFWFREAVIHLEADTLPGEYLEMVVYDPDGWVVWQSGGSSLLDAVLTWANPGVYTIEVSQVGFSARDVPFEGAVDVRYGEPSRREVNSAQGAVSFFNGDFDLPIAAMDGATHLAVDVMFGRSLPTDDIVVVLEGPDGIEEARGGGHVTFSILDPTHGPWSIRVKAGPSTLVPVEFSVVTVVEYAPYSERMH